MESEHEALVHKQSCSREGGYTADDLDQLPGLRAHTELIDGSLVPRQPQNMFHMRTVTALEQHLIRRTPAELEVIREMTVTLDRRNRPEPDLMLVRADADTGLDQTTYHPEDVLLAVEVASPDSVARDRGAKPQKYAAAGIRHFWRVENDEGRPIVYVYELDPAKNEYVPTGIHHDQLKLTEPFPIDVDLNEIRAGRAR
ncbi:Uma2 family endonuclease [Streptomyces sp. ODS28]|uniref:Uma2 family endonuclease n=1 Tax=Streptomyces sp. ODS28 TaxID=3136688 RepID=UPI0031E9354F